MNDSVARSFNSPSPGTDLLTGETVVGGATLILSTWDLAIVAE